MTIASIVPARFPWYDYTRYSFSIGLKTSAGTYLSGHTASEYDPASGRIVVRGAMSDQVRVIYDKIAAILAGGDLDSHDVVRIVEYVRTSSIGHYAQAEAVRAAVFGDRPPVVNTVPVRSLLRPDAAIEIEVTAASARGAAHDAVFLPTIQPVDDEGNIVGAGDVVAQMRAIFDRAARMLSAQGLGLDRVVKTATYVSAAALAGYEGTEQVRRERLGPVFPASVEIVMPRLLHPQALVQCDFIATRDAPIAVRPDWSLRDDMTRSPAVRAGKLLYLSGQSAVDPVSGQALHEGDVVAQAESIYGNVLKLVRAAGGVPRQLVKTIEYVATDSLGRYREVSGVRSRVLQEPLPASTGLVSEMPLHPGHGIVVDALAVLD